MIHNPTDDIQDCVKLLEQGAVYKDHDRHAMKGGHRFMFWFTSAVMYAAIGYALYLIARIFI